MNEYNENTKLTDLMNGIGHSESVRDVNKSDFVRIVESLTEEQYITDEPKLNEAESNVGNEPKLDEDDDIIELGDDFDFDGFQVVRREFFAHTREPSCTFNNFKFYVSSACLSKFPSSDYAQVLINRQRKILALRPCPEYSRDTLKWCNFSKGKRKPRQITCTLLWAGIVELMGWEPEHRYKMLGQIIHSKDEYLVAFDLNSAEVYLRETTEGEKPKNSRIPVFPIAWKDQFGLPYSEHKKAMQVNIVDGYTVFSITDEKKNQDNLQNDDENNQDSSQTADDHQLVALESVTGGDYE